MSTRMNRVVENDAVFLDDRGRELLRERYYAGLEGAALSTVCIAALLVLGFWNEASPSGLLIWAALICTSAVPPVLLKRRSPSMAFNQWLMRAYLVEGSQGILWGSVTLLAMPNNAVGQVILVSVVVVVLMAGSVSSSQFTVAYLCFTVPLVLTTILGIVFCGADGVGATVAIVAVAWLFGAAVAKDQRKLQLEVVGVAQSNEKLLASLEERHHELTATNQALVQAKQRADSMARTDPLTGLANRHAFDEHVQLALRSLDHGLSQNVTLAFFDLDGFKKVNDHYGHGAGDALLCAIANRLQARVRKAEQCARIGGDELVLLATDSDPVELGCRLLELFEDAVVLDKSIVPDGRPMEISASIGVATVTTSVDRDELMSRADAAQYTAKYAGGGRFVLWSGDTQQPAQNRDPDDRRWPSLPSPQTHFGYRSPAELAADAQI